MAKISKKSDCHFFAHLYSSQNAFPKQKTQLVAFCHTINPDNAGGWRVRAVVKTCRGFSAAGDQEVIQPAGLSYKGGVNG